MSKRMVLALVVSGFFGFWGLPVATACAQATDTVPIAPPTDNPTVDHVERAANGLVRGGPGGGGFRTPDGVGMVSPGALVFASFDANHDGKVTKAEVETGAASAFLIADKNKDGVITGFEQTDWAAAMGGLPDILANPMTFDVDLDNKISPSEFAAALKRIAGQLSPSGEIAFSELVRPLNRNDEKGPPGAGPNLGSLTGRASGPLPGGHPN